MKEPIVGSLCTFFLQKIIANIGQYISRAQLIRDVLSVVQKAIIAMLPWH